MKLAISRRLALMFAGCGLLVFSLFGIVLQVYLQHELDRHQRAELATRVQIHESMIRRTADVTRWETIVRIRLDTLTPENGRTRFWVLGADPRFRYGSPDAENEPALARDGYGEMQIAGMDSPLKTLTYTVPANGERPDVRFVVATDQAPYRRTLQVMTIALIVMSLSGILLVAVLGNWIALIALRPLERLSQDAHALSPRQLSQRLNRVGLPKELSELTGSFNGALDRLESAYQQLEGFNADVAHELRTPLTNLIGQTQVALSRERGAGELEEVLQSNLEELERLRAIINDMLFLARADQGMRARDRVEASLAQEIGKTVEYLDVLLDDAGVSVRVEGDARIAVETALLGRAMTNLLINAVQHSEREAEIVVEILQEPQGARIAVRNPGPAIATEHLTRLFDRFYRLDSARSGSRDNHGLGLAIVRAIASMHGGAVFASSENGINTFGFTLATTPV